RTPASFPAGVSESNGGEPEGSPPMYQVLYGQGFAVGQLCAVPGIATAPGPGRSPAASTVGSKVGRMEKTLTSLAAAGPPTMLAELPMAVTVLLLPPAGPKAPLLRCSQLSNVPLQAGPTAMPFSQQSCAVAGVVPWKAPVLSASRQKPEKTRLWTLTVLPVSFVAVVPVHETVPLERLKFTGSVPMLKLLLGGQSLLVGYDGFPPRVEVPATQAMPLFGPPMQLPPVQSGQGWMPAMVLPGSVAVSPVRKRTDDSGRLRDWAPVLQFTVPEAAVATTFSTQTLVGVLPGFGTARGAPKRQPPAEQL